MNSVLTATSTIDALDKPASRRESNEITISTAQSTSSAFTGQECTAASSGCTDGDRLINNPLAYRRPCLLEQSPDNRENVYLYPYSEGEVSDDDIERFHEVIERYRRILVKSSKTNAVLTSGRITIQSFMAGPSPKEAVASIIVTCNPQIFEVVRGLLIQRPLHKSQDDRKFIKKIGKKGSISKNKEPEKPVITHFYTGGPAARALGGNDYEVSAAGHGVYYCPSLCGYHVKTLDGSSFSTLSWILEHDGLFYGLTTAHAFYESCYAQSLFNSATRNGGEGYAAPCEIQLETAKIHSTVWFPSRGRYASDISGEDWGLILFDKMAVKTWRIQSSPFKSPNVKGVVKKHPEQPRKVILYSSVKSPMTGILVHGVTHLVTLGVEDISLWSVELSSNSCLRPGVSGSLVVDALTEQAYGYVVASDPFDKALIVPLHTALKDISARTQMKEIKMAEPGLVPTTFDNPTNETCNHTTDHPQEIPASDTQKANSEITIENDEVISEIFTMFMNDSLPASIYTHLQDQEDDRTIGFTTHDTISRSLPLRAKSPPIDLSVSRVTPQLMYPNPASCGISAHTSNAVASFLSIARYECPFDRLGCSDVFSSFRPWYEHSLTHFGVHEPPTRNSCCFCPEIFEENSGKHSWQSRMRHVQRHHDRGERTATSRFDVELYRYLWSKGLITDYEWKHLTLNQSLILGRVNRRGVLQSSDPVSAYPKNSEPLKPYSNSSVTTSTSVSVASSGSGRATSSASRSTRSPIPSSAYEPLNSLREARTESSPLSKPTVVRASSSGLGWGYTTLTSSRDSNKRT